MPPIFLVFLVKPLLLLAGLTLGWFLVRRWTRDRTKTPVFRVWRVLDGDTVDLQLGFFGPLFRVRMASVDASETRARPGSSRMPSPREVARGQAAAAWLEQRLASGRVTVEFDGRCKYGRYVGILHDDRGNINLELIRAGHARYVPNWGNPSRDLHRAYVAAQERARQSRSGIWAGA